MLKTTRKPILVVEDDPDIRALLVEVLTEAGYEVVCSRSASEGLGLLISSTGPAFQLITLDLNLPDMSGISFLEELARHTEAAYKVPVVVVSANPPHLIASPQVKGVIAKPFDLDTLLETIDRAA